MPAKDYLTGIKLDPNERFTVDETSVTIVDLDLGETAYIYWDEGIDALDGDYEYLLDIRTASASSTGAKSYAWALANEVNNMSGIGANDLGSHAIMLYEIGAPARITLYELTTGGSTYNANWNGVVNTQYYLRIVRNESVGEFGTLYCFVYSDSERLTLVTTLSLALHEKIDLRYIYAVNSVGVGAVESYDGVFSNLERIEGAVFQVAWARNSNQIIGVAQ